MKKVKFTFNVSKNISPKLEFCARATQEIYLQKLISTLMLVPKPLKRDVNNYKPVKKSNTRVVSFSCESNNLAALIATRAVISFVWY